MLVVLAGAATAALLGTPAAPVAKAQAASCPAPPKTLGAGGAGPVRFTMLIRVNQLKNAEVYANPDPLTGGLAGRIHPNDVFVVNTRFHKTTPGEWTRTVEVLRSAFPCNRIVALNGMGANPTLPGYAHALSGESGLWGVLTDWEKADWNLARLSSPWFRPWSGRFRTTRKRVRNWVGGLVSGLSQSGPYRRAGLAPQYRDKWDYGSLGREVSGQNRRLGLKRRGIQSVQTQDACAFGGPRGMKTMVGRLLRQYKLANYKRIRLKRAGRGKRFRYTKRRWRTDRRNLGVQISFSGTPSAGAGMAVLRTSPTTAAGCTLTTLRRGGGAIFYWASPDSMRLLYTIPAICSLRPPPPGRPC